MPISRSRPKSSLYDLSPKSLDSKQLGPAHFEHLVDLIDTGPLQAVHRPRRMK